MSNYLIAHVAAPLRTMPAALGLICHIALAAEIESTKNPRPPINSANPATQQTKEDRIRDLAKRNRIAASKDGVDLKPLFELSGGSLPKSMGDTELVDTDLPDALSPNADDFLNLFKTRTWRSRTGEKAEGVVVGFGDSKVTIDVDGKAVTVPEEQFVEVHQKLLKKMRLTAIAFAEAVNQAADANDLILTKHSDIEEAASAMLAEVKAQEKSKADEMSARIKSFAQASIRGGFADSAIPMLLSAPAIDWDSAEAVSGSSKPQNDGKDSGEDSGLTPWAFLKQWIVSERSGSLKRPLSKEQFDSDCRAGMTSKELLELIGLPDEIIPTGCDFWYFEHSPESPYEENIFFEPPLPRLPRSGEAYITPAQEWIYHDMIQLKQGDVPVSFVIGDGGITYRKNTPGRLAREVVPWNFENKVMFIKLPMRLHLPGKPVFTSSPSVYQLLNRIKPSVKLSSAKMEYVTTADEVRLWLGEPDEVVPCKYYLVRTADSNGIEVAAGTGVPVDRLPDSVKASYLNCEKWVYKELVVSNKGDASEAFTVWIGREDLLRVAETGQAVRAVRGTIAKGRVVSREWRGQLYDLLNLQLIGEHCLDGGAPHDVGRRGFAAALAAVQTASNSGETSAQVQPSRKLRPTAESLQRKWHLPSGPISQEEFFARVRIGADIDEIIAVIGRPDDVEKSSKPVNPGQTWAYRRLVLHSITQKAATAKLYFDDTGHVDTIIWDGRFWSQGDPGVQVVPGGYRGPNPAANGAAAALETLKGF